MTTQPNTAHVALIPCVDCGHAHTDHAVDDEERRECMRCGCVQYRCAEVPAAEASSP